MRHIRRFRSTGIIFFFIGLFVLLSADVGAQRGAPVTVLNTPENPIPVRVQDPIPVNVTFEGPGAFPPKQLPSFYVTITGEVQGSITQSAGSQDSIGTLYRVGHEDEIHGLGLSQGVVVPTDPESGLPSGRRRHNALSILKYFDKSSPLLFQALATGEGLTAVDIRFYRLSETGTLEHYFTVKLEDARIVNITAESSKNWGRHTEEVGFTYRKITWTHELAGSTSSDDWSTPVE